MVAGAGGSRMPRLAEAVSRNPYLDLIKVPGLGRGLFASVDIPAGTVLVDGERPIVSVGGLEVAPRQGGRGGDACQISCHACQAPIYPNTPYIQTCDTRKGNEKNTKASLRCDSAPFCSEACHKDALNSWHMVEQRCDFDGLKEFCRKSNRKYPLLAARLACMKIQRSMKLGDPAHGVYLRGDEDMQSLCHVTTEAAAGSGVPEDWRVAYDCMVQGMQEFSTIIQSLIPSEWFFCMMSRIHINSFKMDIIPAVTDSFSLAQAAFQSTSTGSAVYLLGSMFNHSCVPNVSVSFPRNNNQIRFTSLVDIPKGAHATISYVDTEMHRQGRQEALLYGYGFSCSCPRCQQSED